MAESIVAAKRAVAGWTPSAPARCCREGFQGDVGRIGSIDRGAQRAGANAAGLDTGTVNDADTTALFADRQARLALLARRRPTHAERGQLAPRDRIVPGLVGSGAWNAEPWRCLGYSLQAQGFHQEAIAAFRRAEQYDPLDSSLDAAIDKSQRGIVVDFLNRYRR